MKLENQVLSLELAKKMKELGFEQESYVYWENVRKKKPSWFLTNRTSWATAEGNKCSAYTVAELGEMLSTQYSHWRKASFNNDPHYQASFKYSKDLDSHTEADARASMLIYLKENKLL